MRVFIVLALLPLLAAMAQAQPKMCTQMWCDEGLTLQFEAARWPAGVYKMELEVDGAPVTCTASLPLPPCGEAAFECSANDNEIAVITEGCALPQNAQKLGGIHMRGVPEQLTAKVSMPDGTIRDMASAVAAQCGYPNGEGCDERQCCSARMTLSLR